MTKLEVVAALKEKGIQASLESGVIYLNGVRYQEACGLMKELDYHASFGVRAEKKKESKGAADLADENSEEEQEPEETDP